MIKAIKIAALAAAFASTLMSIEAEADVARRCSNAVCGASTYDGRRVSIYLGHQMSGVTHYNFKTNPGAQIEISGHYSFAQRRGNAGTYSAQACKRGGFGRPSFCTAWTTFRWNAVE